jgi:hypothetical protein
MEGVLPRLSCCTCSWLTSHNHQQCCPLLYRSIRWQGGSSRLGQEAQHAVRVITSWLSDGLHLLCHRCVSNKMYSVRFVVIMTQGSSKAARSSTRASSNASCTSST